MMYYGDLLFKTKYFREAATQTLIDNFGVDSPMKSTEVVIKNIQSKKEKYDGRTYNINKFRQTMKEKYGGVGYSASYFSDFMLEKYGVEHYSLKFVITKSIYYCDDYMFDSLPELAFYIYARDRNVLIFRNDGSIRFLYQYNNKMYYYFPDFIYNNTLIEIKGDHFFKDDGTMCNPYDHSQDEKYEAKHLCGLLNGVKFLTSKYYNYVLLYFNTYYDADFYLIKNNIGDKDEQFRGSTEED